MLSQRFAERPPPSGGPGSSNTRRSLVLALPVIACAVVLGFAFLGAKSLWLDEVRSVSIARLDWRSLWYAIAYGEPNMSLYFLILHFWLRLGIGETVVRSLSVLAAVASIVPFFAMRRRLFGRSHALVASVLLVANPFFIQYAQEALKSEETKRIHRRVGAGIVGGQLFGFFDMRCCSGLR